MTNKKTFYGAKIHKYVEFPIHRLNSMLKEAGCKRARAYYRHEEESECCKFSCEVEDGITPFYSTVGNARRKRNPVQVDRRKRRTREKGL